jgi:hypothetical protein
MKASEILHGLAELLAGLEDSNGATQPTEVPVSKFTPNTQEPVSAQQGAVFVPPLQAKIELLKKAVDVDSIYDRCGEDGDLTGQGADNEDELSRMRKMAGINPVVADEAASDDPLGI